MSRAMDLDHPWAELAGSAVVVTGAARGLGRAITEAFLARGATVVGGDLDGDALQRTAEDLSGDFHPVTGDVSDTDGVGRIEDAVRDSGRDLTTWVNNAGIVGRSRAEDITPEFWDRVMAVNVRSVLLGAQAARRLMLPRRRGSIVNLSSVMGTRTYELRAAYGTSKAAVAHLTRHLADAWGPEGIRVNAIAPGFMATEMSSWVTDDPVRAEQVLAGVPLRRFGTPQDVARLTLTLSSPLTDYVTGQVLHLDGGWST